MLSVNVKAPDIKIIESAFRGVGLSDCQIWTYLPRTLLCLDYIQSTKGYVSSTFFRCIADKITINGDKITYIKLLKEALLIKKTMNYIKGVRPNKYRVEEACYKQSINITKKDKERIDKAIASLSEPKMNKTLDWLNQSLQHISDGGVYFALEDIPQGWYDIPHSDIISVFLYEKLQNVLRNLMYSNEDKIYKEMLLADIIHIERGLQDPELRKKESYLLILSSYSKYYKEYLSFIRDVIDRVVKDCKENNVLVACEGNRIWSDKIKELRQYVALHLGSHLERYTQHSIAF